MSRDTSFYLVDIFIAIFKIKQYTKHFSNAEDLKWSFLEWDATLRELEIIGEAVKNLINLNVLPNKEYRKIVDFRNVITHAYFGIDEDEVWEVVTNKLDVLSTQLKSIIVNQNIDIENTVNFAIEENIKNRNIVVFLKELKEKSD